MQSHDLEIRFAEFADASVLAELLLESNHHYWGESSNSVAMTAASAEAMISGQSGCRAVIAWNSGAPAAFATVSVLHPALSEHGTLFMKDLFVSESARGSGIGKLVMNHLGKLAVELGCKRFDWTAEQDNPRALEFYDSLGASQIKEKVYFRISGKDLAVFSDT